MFAVVVAVFHLFLPADVTVFDFLLSTAGRGNCVCDTFTCWLGDLSLVLERLWGTVLLLLLQCLLLLSVVFVVTGVADDG